MRDEQRAIDRLVFLACGEDEKRYEEVARGMVEFKNYTKHMNDLMYSGFNGTTREEFEEWREERVTNYRMVMNAYDKLTYRGDAWMT